MHAVTLANWSAQQPARSRGSGSERQKFRNVSPPALQAATHSGLLAAAANWAGLSPAKAEVARTGVCAVAGAGTAASGSGVAVRESSARRLAEDSADIRASFSLWI
jgi:hypothetical protein